MPGDSRNGKAQSQGLVSIVAVVYGVPLTQALTTQSGVIFNPQRAAYFIPAMALLASLLLSSYSFFSYVLVRADLRPYDIQWTRNSSKWKGALDFAADLLIAALYVRTLTAALAVPITNGNLRTATAPDLRQYFVTLIPLFAVGFAVRLVRKPHTWSAVIPLLALGGSIGLVAFSYHLTMTRRNDLDLVYALLGGVVVYIVANHATSYFVAKHKQLIA